MSITRHSSPSSDSGDEVLGVGAFTFGYRSATSTLSPRAIRRAVTGRISLPCSALMADVWLTRASSATSFSEKPSCSRAARTLMGSSFITFLLLVVLVWLSQRRGILRPLSSPVRLCHGFWVWVAGVSCSAASLLLSICALGATSQCPSHLHYLIFLVQIQC